MIRLALVIGIFTKKREKRNSKCCDFLNHPLANFQNYSAFRVEACEHRTKIEEARANTEDAKVNIEVFSFCLDRSTLQTHSIRGTSYLFSCYST